ncbi:MAG: glycosyltransferase family 39 protein [Vicinamibacterales bacterium]
MIVEATRGRAGGHTGAVIGVALLALAPAFLRWSLQVRTDQPALMFAVWGGVALLASTRRAWLAALAGAGFGLGFLCSQKALYVAALAATLLAVRLAPDLKPRTAPWRRGVVLIVIAGSASLAVVVAFRVIVSAFYQPQTMTSLSAGFSTFADYRSVFRIPGLLGDVA